MSPTINSPKCIVCGSTVGPTHSHWPEGPLCAKCAAAPRPSPGASAGSETPLMLREFNAPIKKAQMERDAENARLANLSAISSPGASAEDGAREAKRVEEIREYLRIGKWTAPIPTLHAVAKDLLRYLDARAARESERERVAEGMAKALEDLRLDEATEYEGRIDASCHFSVDALHAAREALAAYRAQRPETETRT